MGGYGGGDDEARRWDFVIACSSRFEDVFETMEKVDDGWRFPKWLR